MLHAWLSVLVLLPLAAADTSCQRPEATNVTSTHFVLLWHEPVAGAAAALLRATLIHMGYDDASVVIRYTPAAAEVCTLLTAERSSLLPEGLGWERAVLVAPAVRAQSVCSWREAEYRLRALAHGAAPLTPRLYVQFAVGTSENCTRRLQSGDLAALAPCGFPSSPESGVTVFLPRGEWSTEKLMLPEPLRTRELSRRELAELLASRNASTLFVDASLWGADEAFELPIRVADEVLSLLLVDESEIQKRAPALIGLLNGTFTPQPASLRTVLEDADVDPRNSTCAEMNLERAGQKQAAQDVSFAHWKEKASKPRVRFAVATLCLNDEPISVFERVVTGAVPFYARLRRLNETSLTAQIEIEMVIERVNCSSPLEMVDRLLNMRCAGDPWTTIGVALPAELAGAVAAVVAADHLPLVAYTPGASAVRAATGSPARLANALALAFESCDWRRVAVLSDGSVLARAMETELAALAAAAEEGLELRVARADAVGLNSTLSGLVEADARVFVVLGSAWPVLEEAHARELAAARGYVWLVTELDAPDGPAARPVLEALAPVSVSFQFRGGARSSEPSDGGLLYDKMRRALRGAPWPRRLAALADALLTLTEGHARLVRQYGSFDHHDEPNKLKYFWEGVESAPVPGVDGELHYEAGELRHPPVYIECWTNTSSPQRLAVWTDLRVSRDCPLSSPPPDGRVACAWRYGPAFEQHCLDIACGATLLGLYALAMGAAFGRRWFVRRDRRLQRAATLHVLAQREAAFAELVPHAVDPAALQLGDDLGAGHFGCVRVGDLRRVRRTVRVAVKAPREDASPAEESEFLREVRMLAELRHERIVRFEGVCWDGGPPLLLMEFALFGDLLHYLRARRHLEEGDADAAEAAHVSAPALTRLAREAAEALAYLAECKLVHRDVRAVNCLVDARRSLKLADFGLARRTGVDDGEYACQRPALLPVLWMAPESLARGVATHASDVWSFGVLTLELVTLGARPWGTLPPAAAVRAVLEGSRAPVPHSVSAETRALLAACWRREPSRRPPAARLVHWLARRPAALRPAPEPEPPEPDCDSGIGDPDTALHSEHRHS